MVLRWEGETLVIAGELDVNTAGDFVACIGSLPVPAGAIDLRDFEIADGVSTAMAVDAIRGLLSRSGLLVVHHAPQVLAHTLYRTGLLESGKLRLVDPREEEPYG